MTPTEQRGVPVDPNEVMNNLESIEIPEMLEIIPPSPVSHSLTQPSLRSIVSKVIAHVRQRLQLQRQSITTSTESLQITPRRLNFDVPSQTQSTEDCIQAYNLRRLRRLQMINTRLRRRARERRLALERLRHLIQNQTNEEIMTEREARIRQEYLIRLLHGEDPEHPGLTK